MSFAAVREALLAYLLFIPLLTFHEWAHAWSAWKLGDDTAHRRGRVSFNPIVHMELVGTVILPLAAFITGALGVGIPILGWGKPVPVNPSNLKNPRVGDSIVAMAGPAMNLLLALALLAAVKVSVILNQNEMAYLFSKTAIMSLVLCFFNLIPIPPLDGSHLWANALGVSAETYFRMSQFGFIAVFVIIQFPAVQNVLAGVVGGAFGLMARMVGLE